MAAVIILLVLVIILLIILHFASYKRTHNRAIDHKIVVSINGGEYKEFESSPEKRAKWEKEEKSLEKREERRKRHHNIWLVLHYMVTYRQLIQSSNFYDFKNNIAAHKYAQGELRKAHPDSYSFEAAIRFCRMEYYYGACDHQITDNDVKLILNWQSNIIDTHGTLKSVLSAYKEHWDGVLASYVRPSARIKRLQYLVENLEDMMNLPDIQEYPDILQGMRELQNQYQLQLNENPQ